MYAFPRPQPGTEEHISIGDGETGGGGICNELRQTHGQDCVCFDISHPAFGGHPFDEFDTIEILTKGGPSKTTYVMMYAIFEKAIMQNITSIGAAITVVFIVFIILLTFFQRYVIEKRVHY